MAILGSFLRYIQITHAHAQSLSSSRFQWLIYIYIYIYNWNHELLITQDNKNDHSQLSLDKIVESNFNANITTFNGVQNRVTMQIGKNRLQVCHFLSSRWV